MAQRSVGSKGPRKLHGACIANSVVLEIKLREERKKNGEDRVPCAPNLCQKGAGWNRKPWTHFSRLLAAIAFASSAAPASPTLFSLSVSCIEKAVSAKRPAPSLSSHACASRQNSVQDGTQRPQQARQPPRHRYRIFRDKPDSKVVQSRSVPHGDLESGWVMRQCTSNKLRSLITSILV